MDNYEQVDTQLTNKWKSLNLLMKELAEISSGNFSDENGVKVVDEIPFESEIDSDDLNDRRKESNSYYDDIEDEDENYDYESDVTSSPLTDISNIIMKNTDAIAEEDKQNVAKVERSKYDESGREQNETDFDVTINSSSNEVMENWNPLTSDESSLNSDKFDSMYNSLLGGIDDKDNDDSYRNILKNLFNQDKNQAGDDDLDGDVKTYASATRDMLGMDVDAENAESLLTNADSNMGTLLNEKDPEKMEINSESNNNVFSTYFPVLENDDSEPMYYLKEAAKAAKNSLDSDDNNVGKAANLFDSVGIFNGNLETTKKSFSSEDYDSLYDKTSFTFSPDLDDLNNYWEKGSDISNGYDDADAYDGGNKDDSYNYDGNNNLNYQNNDLSSADDKSKVLGESGLEALKKLASKLPGLNEENEEEAAKIINEILQENEDDSVYDDFTESPNYDLIVANGAHDKFVNIPKEDVIRKHPKADDENANKNINITEIVIIVSVAALAIVSLITIAICRRHPGNLIAQRVPYQEMKDENAEVSIKLPQREAKNVYKIDV